MRIVSKFLSIVEFVIWLISFWCKNCLMKGVKRKKNLKTSRTIKVLFYCFSQIVYFSFLLFQHNPFSFCLSLSCFAVLLFSTLDFVWSMNKSRFHRRPWHRAARCALVVAVASRVTNRDWQRVLERVKDEKLLVLEWRKGTDSYAKLSFRAGRIRDWLMLRFLFFRSFSNIVGPLVLKWPLVLPWSSPALNA